MFNIVRNQEIKVFGEKSYFYYLDYKQNQGIPFLTTITGDKTNNIKTRDKTKFAFAKEEETGDASKSEESNNPGEE